MTSLRRSETLRPLALLLAEPATSFGVSPLSGSESFCVTGTDTFVPGRTRTWSETALGGWFVLGAGTTPTRTLAVAVFPYASRTMYWKLSVPGLPAVYFRESPPTSTRPSFGDSPGPTSSTESPSGSIPSSGTVIFSFSPTTARAVMFFGMGGLSFSASAAVTVMLTVADSVWPRESWTVYTTFTEPGFFPALKRTTLSERKTSP